MVSDAGIEAISAILFEMEKQGVSRPELAGRLRISEGRLATLIMSGGNMSLSTLGMVAEALNRRVEITLVDEHARPEPEPEEVPMEVVTAARFLLDALRREPASGPRSDAVYRASAHLMDALSGRVRVPDA